MRTHARRPPLPRIRREFGLDRQPPATTRAQAAELRARREKLRRLANLTHWVFSYLAALEGLTASPTKENR